MKTLTVFILALLLNMLPSAAQQFQWTPKLALPGLARQHAASFSINGKGYFTTGGNLATSQYFNDTWEFNPASNTWSQKANFPGSTRYGAMAFSIGNIGFAGCGTDGTPFTDFYKYDAVANSWTPISNFPGSGRSKAVAFSSATKGYAGLGFPLLNDFYEYDPVTDIWSAASNFPGSPRFGSAVFSMNGNGYVICGEDANGFLNETWEFSTTTNSWNQKSTFPGNSLSNAVGFTAGQYGIVGTGKNASGCFDVCYIYNATNDQWCGSTTLPGDAREGASAITINNRGYIGLGANCSSVHLNDFYELKFLNAAINYNQIVCNTFEFTANTPSTPVSLLWYFGDGTTSTAATLTHNFPQPGLYTVSLVVNYACGKDSIVQQVSTGPAASATYDLVIDTCNLTVQVQNQSFTSFTFYWSFGDGTTSNQINPSHTYAASGTYVISQIISDDCGTDSVSQTIIFPVVGNPVAQFSALADSCNQSVAFTNTSSNAVNILWDFGDGNISNLQNPVHTYSSPGTYNVWLTINNSCGIDSVQQQVIVSAGNNPISAFTVTVDSCTQSITLINNSTGTNTYLWDFGDGTTDTAFNTVHIYDASATWTVTLIAQNSCGIDTSTQTFFIPQPVLPTAGFTYSLDTCNGTVLFNNTSTGTNYNWNFGDGNSSSATNPSHVYNAGSYNVTLISQNSCGVDSASQLVTVLPYQTPQSAFTVSLDTCNYTISITNNTTSATTYNWTFGDGGTDTVSNPVHTYAGAGNYIVTLYASNYCQNDSISLNINLPNASLPTAGFTYTLDTCNGTIQFTNTSSGTNFNWNFGDGNTSSQVNPSHVYNAGAYTVSLIALNSCGVDSTSQSVTVLPYQTPQPAFTISLDTCNYTVTITNSTTSATTYNWTFGDGGTDTVANPVHTFGGAGNYVITLIASNYCQNDSISLNINLPNASTPTAGFTYSLDTCNGTVQFNNTSTGTTYNWNFGDGNSSSQVNPLHIYNSGTYTVTLIAWNSCGIDSTSQLVTVLPYQTPQPAFTFSLDTCTYTISFTNSTTSATTYNWTFGDGGTDTVANPVHIYAGAGNYVITLYTSNYCQNDSISQNINLPNASTPTAGFTYSLDTCNGTVQFNNTSTGTTYNWNFGDGNSSSQINPSHIYNSGTYTVTLIALNSCGVDSTSQSVTVLPYQTPQPAFTISLDTCNYTVTITNSTTSATTYNWTFGDGGTDTVPNPVHTYTGAGNYVITLYASNYCQNDSVTQNINIPNSSTPTAGFTYSLDTCNGTIQFTNTSTGTNFNWSFGDGNSSSVTNPSHTYNAGTYTVTLTALNSCGVDSSSQSVTVLPYLTPQPAFTFSLDTCMYTISLTNSTTSATTYNWTFGDGGSDTVANPVHIYAGAGNYIITLNASNNCLSNTVQLPITIPISTAPVAAFSALTDTCTGTITLSNTSSAGNYQWNFGDGNYTTQSNPVHTYTTPSIYIITLTIQNSCGIDSISVSIDLTSAQPAVATFTSNVNPCNNLVSLSSTGSGLLSWYINNQFYSSAASTTYQSTTTGLLPVLLIAQSSCNADSMMQQITLNTITTPELSYDYTIDSCLNSIIINNNSEGYNSISWNFGDGITSIEAKPTHIYTNAGIYTVTVNLYANCDTLFDSFDVSLTSFAGNVIIPNIFTPNGDGQNDYFRIENISTCTSYSMLIYNRWGDIVFQDDAASDGWDGRYDGQPCAEGSYYCILSNGGKNYTFSVLLQR